MDVSKIIILGHSGFIGKAVLDYIQDAARLITELFLKNISDTYNLANGSSYSFREILEYLRSIISKNFDLL